MAAEPPQIRPRLYDIFSFSGSVSGPPRPAAHGWDDCAKNRWNKNDAMKAITATPISAPIR